VWRLGPAQGRAMNRVRVGRQQLSVDCALCRSQLGRHTERPGRPEETGPKLEPEARARMTGSDSRTGGSQLRHDVRPQASGKGVVNLEELETGVHLDGAHTTNPVQFRKHHEH
jgi:hypothetical protein